MIILVEDVEQDAKNARLQFALNALKEWVPMEMNVKVVRNVVKLALPLQQFVTHAILLLL